MSSSFYVVVASDASIDQYPENTPSSFKMQLPSQLHLSEDWEVAMTHIIYPHTWENIHSNQVSCLLRYNGEKECTLLVYLHRDTYRTVEDLIIGMVTGLESAFPDIYIRSGKKIKRLGGKECFYIHEKVKYYYELYLPTGLPKNLAQALRYRDLVPALYHTSSPTSVQLNKNQSVSLTATTTTIRRNDELVWGVLSKHSFQTAGKQFFTEAFRDMTQQQGRGKVYKRKRKANSVSTRQVKKARTSSATFKTIFD